MMEESTDQTKGKGPASAGQTRVRYELNLPASVRITSSVMTQPFNIRDVTIRYVESSARGLSLMMETRTTRQDLSKMLVRRRTCYINCQFPGAGSPSRLFGVIDLVEPRLTSEDILIRFLVGLDEDQPKLLADLRTFLKTIDEEGGVPQS
jgi:hypothetical protein